MNDTAEGRKLVAKVLRRGDVYFALLDGWDADRVEELRADLERQIRRPVTATRGTASRNRWTFDAGKKPAKDVAGNLFE